MKSVAFFHKDTGALHPFTLVVSDDGAVKLNTPPDHIAIDQPVQGSLDPLSQRVDVATLAVVDYQPAQPSADHEWNAAAKRWQLSSHANERQSGHRNALQQIAALEASQARAVREHLLGNAEGTKRLQAIETEISQLRASVLR